MIFSTKVQILDPGFTQSAKVDQSRAYGSEVILVPGEREDTAAKAIELAERTIYASHNWHPMFLQGTKSLGYEIWEDLGFTAPDNIVLPVSEGSSLLGCYIAFKELLRSGEIDRMPRLFASQPENCVRWEVERHTSAYTDFGCLDYECQKSRTNIV